MKTKALYILLLFVVFTIPAFSQTKEMRTISGILRDASGEEVIGASIVEEGTANGTMTDIDGYYELNVPLGSTIKVSYIGMKPRSMKVTTKNSIPYAGFNISQVRPPVTAPITTPETGANEPVRIEKDNNDPNKTLSPYFLVKTNGESQASLPLKSTDVVVNIAGVIADVSVKQTYINTGKETLEAIYVFPGSTRAAVYGMSMTVGTKKIDALIKKKEQARQEYEAAKKEGKSASLLEQHRPNVFQMNVANILPGDTVLVEMRYTELLENIDGQYEFVYPTVVGPRFTQGGEEWVSRSTNDFFSQNKSQFTIKTIVQAGMPIQKIASPSHNLSIEHPTPDQVTATLSNPKDFQGNKDYILQYQLQGGAVESGLLRYEHGDENFFLLMMQPPKTPTIDQIPPREYVFIVDVSGSMHGTPLDISKKLLRKLTSSLRPIDKFNVILFESGNEMLYKESVPATEENIENAMKVINRQKGGGWTNLYPTLQKAMEMKEVDGYSRTFLILTDGYVTIEKEAFQYVRNHLGEANLFPFGIGSNVNRYMIEGLANAGMGDPYIITNQSDAEEIGDMAIKKISEPVLTKIKIDWDNWDVYDVEPMAVPDVFAQRPILVYGKYRGDAKGAISVSGIAGDKKYSQTFDVKAARQEHNQALRYLWARNQIRYYDDFAQYYEGNSNSSGYIPPRSAKQIETVTNLGLKYNLLTQYTSFLAVEDEVRKPNYNREKVEYTPIKKKVTVPTESHTSSMTLEEDEQTLDEMVVVAYGRTGTHCMTGSTQTISGTDLGSFNSLQGRVAGVQITQTSGEPSNSPKIMIRGASSIIDKNTPICILDGVEVDYNTINSLNINDIDNINIIKDQSATAIYGSRAANGVIVITTKKLNKKQAISFSSSISLDMPTKLPKMQNEYAQGRPVGGVSQWNKTNEAFSWGPKVSDIGAPTYDALDFFELGYTLKNNLTFQRKYKKHDFGFSLGNITQEGFVPGSSNQDNTIGFKVQKDNDYGRKFAYDLDLKYRHNKGKRLQRGYNMSSFMYGALTTPPTFDNREAYLANGSQNTAGSVADNPYWSKNNNPFDDKTNQAIASLNMKYKINSYLSINTAANGEYLDTKAKNNLNIGSVYIPNGHIMTRDEDFKRIQAKAFGSYIRTFDQFSLDATLGYEFNNSRRKVERKDGYDLSLIDDYNFSNAATIKNFDKKYNRHSNAAFTNANVGYKETYYLNAGMRSEWSSVTSDALLSTTVGAATNLHRLFYSDWLHYLRVYGNYSVTDRELPLYVDPTYFNSATYSLNDAASHFESKEIVVSDNLKPEKVEHYELGFSAKFLDNKFGLDFSVYQKIGKNQFLPTTTTSSLVYIDNLGKLRNKGLELGLDANILSNRNFGWSSKLIYSIERNKVTGLGNRKVMLAGIDNVVGSYAIDGQPLGVLYGTAYERDGKGNTIIGSDGFPVVATDQTILANPNAKWRMSLLNTLRYRNFIFSVMLEYKHGGKIWNGTQNTMNYYGTSQMSADQRGTTGYIFNGVLADGGVNNIPVDFYGANLADNRWVRYGQYGVSEDAIQDASFLKIRDITLSYKWNYKRYSKSSLMLSIYANNILLYSKAKGIDPETNLTGASNGFGLNYFNIPGATSTGLSVVWEF